MGPILEFCPAIAAKLFATKQYTQLRSTPEIDIEVQHPKIAYDVLQDLIMYCDNKFTGTPTAERYQSGPQMWFHCQTARELGIPVMVEVYQCVMQQIKAKAEDSKKDKEEYEMLELHSTTKETSMLDDNDDWELVDG